MFSSFFHSLVLCLQVYRILISLFQNYPSSISLALETSIPLFVLDSVIQQISILTFQHDTSPSSRVHYSPSCPYSISLPDEQSTVCLLPIMLQCVSVICMSLQIAFPDISLSHQRYLNSRSAATEQLSPLSSSSAGNDPSLGPSYLDSSSSLTRLFPVFSYLIKIFEQYLLNNTSSFLRILSAATHCFNFSPVFGSVCYVFHSFTPISLFL